MGDEPAIGLETWLASTPVPQKMRLQFVPDRAGGAGPYREDPAAQTGTVVLDWKSRSAGKLGAALGLVGFGLLWTALWLMGETAAFVGVGAPVLFGITAANVYIGATQVRISRGRAWVRRKGFPSSTRRSLDGATIKHVHLQRNDPHHEGGITTYTVLGYPHKPWDPEDPSGEYLIVLPERAEAELVARIWQRVLGVSATHGPLWEELGAE